MLTDVEAGRIADVFLETIGLPIRDRISRARLVAPHATDDDIKKVLVTYAELARRAKTDLDMELEELERELGELSRSLGRAQTCE
jgi:hypothetical protein